MIDSERGTGRTTRMIVSVIGTLVVKQAPRVVVECCTNRQRALIYSQMCNALASLGINPAVVTNAQTCIYISHPRREGSSICIIRVAGEPDDIDQMKGVSHETLTFTDHSVHEL